MQYIATRYTLEARHKKVAYFAALDVKKGSKWVSLTQNGPLALQLGVEIGQQFAWLGNGDFNLAAMQPSRPQEKLPTTEKAAASTALVVKRVSQPPAPSSTNAAGLFEYKFAVHKVIPTRGVL